MSKPSRSSNHNSFCSEPLMYFVNEYHIEDSDSDLHDLLDYFSDQCISRPIGALYLEVESPTFAHEVEKMIIMYDWYITNRFWSYHLLYPVVSFLRIYYSIILHSSDVEFHKKMLSVYDELLTEEEL